jgi:arabinofuranosyltransferase
VHRVNIQGISSRRIPLFVALIIFFAVVVIRSAWVCDDAYITFRVVDNFIGGHGLSWNTQYRTQPYTHPFWLFCLAPIYFLFGRIYYCAVFLSVGISLITLILFMFKIARHFIPAVVGCLILIFSKSFIDYSTSGLENPLSHLILAIFFVLYFSDNTTRNGSGSTNRFFLLCLTVCFGVLNRMDLILLFAPPLIFSFLNTKKGKTKYFAFGLGFAPLILWECFSLFYYGFPLPTTYYAKLHTNIPALVLAKNGVAYLYNSLRWDPLTLTVIGATMISVVARYSKRIFLLFPLLGVACYLIYIIRIGGDFMSGRFISAPLFVAVAMLGRIDFKAKYGAAALALIVSLGLLANKPTVTSGASYKNFIKDGWGIADERGFYYRKAGLIPSIGAEQWPGHEWAMEGRQLKKSKTKYALKYTVGYYGFFAGPSVHIFDPFALTDRLLAGLPVCGKWRVGHYTRAYPEGYGDSITGGKNLIANPQLNEYWEKMKPIISGDLLASGRFGKIVSFNFGIYDHLLEQYISEDYYQKDCKSSPRPSR